MKKINQLLLVVLIAAMAAACDNQNNKRSAAQDLQEYVDSVDRANPDYNETSWQAIDNGYRARAERVEAEKAQMKDEDRKKLEDSEQKYAELKSKYETEIGNRSAVDSKVKLRNSLFGEGKIVGDDMSFSFVNAGNMLSVYQQFADGLEANKDTYSREDWDEIKVLYEALDTHKNQDEKNLPEGDNMKIAALKLKISGLFAMNRPGSKVDENSEAKK